MQTSTCAQHLGVLAIVIHCAVNMLAPGTKLGRYEIRAKLGEGGMGEVYRALDPAINREVAIKILPAGFATDKDRLARFEQEAQAVGALNHPNILVIHHIDVHDGAPYIVSELLEGETLRERMGGVALPQRKAIDYALQTAQGLAAAHEKGIIHRDLKPENLFITKDGRLKILDFGLAKLNGTGDGAQPQTEVPTRRVNTDPGVVMGTIGYMSPEQVRGRPADHRSDIFSFGAILYEMLSGRRAFRGESTADTISAILREDPPDLSGTNPTINPALERVVNHCLEKNPEERFHSARDLAFAVEALSGPATASGDAATLLTKLPAARGDRTAVLPWAIAAALLVACAALALLYFWPRATDKRAISFSIELPDKASDIGEASISPDGRLIVFLANVDGGNVLFLRSLDSIELKELPGTGGAYLPFWSPDSRYIGFFAGGKLKKIDVNGGAPQTICDSGNSSGGTWNPEGVILFSSQGQPLQRVAAAGGAPAVALTLEPKSIQHDYPVFLPDGRHFLYTSWNGNPTNTDLCVAALDGTRRILFTVSSNVGYTSAGFLLFSRDNTLMAQAFDASKLALSGEPFPVLERMAYDAGATFAYFSIAENGTIVFRKSTHSGRQLLWIDRSGKPIGPVGPPGAYNDIMLSPDGTRAAMQKMDGANSDVWIMDLIRSVPLRFTFAETSEDNPSWSADGKYLIYTSTTAANKTTFFRKNASGGGSEEKIYESDAAIDDGTDWSGDGKNLLFEQVSPQGKSDIWVLALDGSGSAHALLNSEFTEYQPRFSPDSHWFAYVSDESGRSEVYVQTFPLSGAKWQVSTGGGAQPRWRHDGKELYFIAPNRKLMAVDIKLGAAFEMGTPKALFQTQVPSYRAPNRYDVSADGQKFLVNSVVQETSHAPLEVIVNWAAGLKK